VPVDSSTWGERKRKDFILRRKKNRKGTRKEGNFFRKEKNQHCVRGEEIASNKRRQHGREKACHRGGMGREGSGKERTLKNQMGLIKETCGGRVGPSVPTKGRSYEKLL